MDKFEGYICDKVEAPSSNIITHLETQHCRF
jgi:hypothetical protein